MSPLSGFNPSAAAGGILNTAFGMSAVKPVVAPPINPQNFLAGFASRLLAPGVSAIKNKDLIQQAIQGNPSALSQSLINVGATAAGLPGAAIIGTDQLLRKTTGRGIVSGIEEAYNQNKQRNLMPGMGIQGFGGMF